MSRAYSRWITTLFSLFLGGMLLWSLALPDKERSETENRTLAQWPTFTWESLQNGSYTKAVEEYFADQFPLRDQWTVLKAHSEQLIGKTEFNKTYLAKGDTLISKVERPDEEQLSKALSYIERLADQTDAEVRIGLIPSAAEVWKDKLPTGAESWDQEIFLKRVEEMGFPTVDFLSALNAHADEPIFYRTDHHWTTLGAFYGANAVLESLGREPLDRTSFTPEVAAEDFCGTLYSQSGVHWLKPDIMEFWVKDEGLSITSWRSGKPQSAPLYDRSFLEKKDKYSAFLGGNQPLCVIENEAVPDGGKILLVRDSYSDSLAPFLAQRFSEIHLMDLRHYHGSVAGYAEENQIDEIVVLYSIPNFITERNLIYLAK